MGILLTFMLLWNMLGALVLIPALSHFLLRHVGQGERGSIIGWPFGKGPQRKRAELQEELRRVAGR